MNISKIKITNFKCFKETFEMDLYSGLNIIVGNNEAGKSTIIEAIHLVLSGFYSGKYLRNELSEYLFNSDTIKEFKACPTSNPPEILIEIFFEGQGLELFEGDCNSEKKKNMGISLKIALDEKDRDLYDDYIKRCGDSVSLPIEYYEVTWKTFSREITNTKHLPFKSALIDANSNRFQNGSDVYIAHIIKTHLETEHKNGLIQAHRRLQDKFMSEDAVKTVNRVIGEASRKSSADKEVKLYVDLSTKNAWENSVLAHVEEIPFHQVGKGYQAIIKTKLALAHKKAQEANIILIEEPENHLSHSRLNQLIKDIHTECSKNDKQIVISTHSSFVANKLGLDKLVLLNEKKQIRLRDLTLETINFFRKISGYDTLRLVLCRAAILCEGDSDELIIQKNYLKKSGVLPIEDGIEVMSVGLSFDRYIEIAEKLNKCVAIVTDNDGKVESLDEKYRRYNSSDTSLVKAFYDRDNNCTTLEPQLIKCNGWELLNEIFDERYRQNGVGYTKGDYKCKNAEQLASFMKDNKTDCALKLFDTAEEFVTPKYIENAVEHVRTK